MEQIIDNLYNKPSLLINSTGHSNALLAFTEEDDINLLLLNKQNNNEFSINLHKDVLNIQKNHDTVLSHIDNTVHISNLTVDNIVSEKSISFNTANTIFETDVILNSKLHLNSYANLPDRIPLIDPATNKIPLSILPQYDDSGSRMVFSKGTHMGIGTSEPQSRLHVFDGHSIYEDSFIGINDRNDYTEPECPIHIRTQYPRIGTPVFKLTNSSNIHTVIMCSENPHIGIGTDTRNSNTDVQLYVDKTASINTISTSNLHATNDIHVNDISFVNMHSNIQLLNDDKERLSIITVDNNSNLFINNQKILKEQEFIQYDPFSNAQWKLNNTKINQLACTTLNTYYLTEGFLYSVEYNKPIATDVISIKTENGSTLVYKTNDKIYLLDDDNTTTIFENCIDVSWDGTYYYFIPVSNTNNIMRRHYLENVETKVFDSTIYTFKALSNLYVITNNNELINIKNKDTIISTHVKTVKNTVFERLDGTVFGNNMLLDATQWDVADNVSSKIVNGSLFINGIITRPSAITHLSIISFTHVACSSRHVAVYDGNSIFTKSLSNDDFKGIGRDNQTVLYGVFNSSVLLPITTHHVDRTSVRINSSCIIGSKSDYLDDIQNDSLVVSGSVGIGCKPDTRYVLNVNGDINIHGRIFVNDNDVGTNGVSTDTNSTPINTNLDNYVTKDMLTQEIQNLESGYNSSEIDNLFSNVNNRFEHVYNTIDNIDLNIDIVTPWQSNLTCNVVYIQDKSVAINTSNIDTEQLGPNKIPALYVGNSGNIRGILCEDDIAVFSDERLKTNIVPVKEALDIISKLNGVYFNRTDVNNKDRYLGLIAQEVENVVPEVVGEVGGYKTVCYSNLIALLIEAIKEIKDILRK